MNTLKIITVHHDINQPTENIRFETALVKIVDKILWSLEPNETFILICMDLSALFNIVDLE